ncbi:MAG: hypothetical protein KAY32_13825 [Candidatus Eisenbacteria sp.]|nr:hypothetical protein [Candidatus Eisenbacteria bacterium]
MDRRHPTREQIARLVLSPDAADRALRAHLEECSTCARLAASIKRSADLLAEARLSSVPRELAEQTLLGLMHQLSEKAAGQSAGAPSTEDRPGAYERLTGSLREVWAALVADSLQTHAAPCRSGTPPPRMLLFETEELAITISLCPGEGADRRDIKGQVVPKEGTGLPRDGLVLAVQGDQQWQSPVSAFGEFRLEAIGAGADDVSILLGDTRVRLRLPA